MLSWLERSCLPPLEVCMLKAIAILITPCLCLLFSFVPPPPLRFFHPTNTISLVIQICTSHPPIYHALQHVPPRPAHLTSLSAAALSKSATIASLGAASTPSMASGASSAFPRIFRASSSLEVLLSRIFPAIVLA